MPRRKGQTSPLRLTQKEARGFRVVVRAVKAAKGVSSQQLADALSVDLRRITDALTEGRPLLAPRAYALLRALADQPATSGAGRVRADSLLLAFNRQCAWLRDGRAKVSPIPAFVTPAAAGAIAARLASELRREMGFGQRKQAGVAKRIETALRQEGPAMVRAWYEAAALSVGQYYQALDAGRWPYEPLGTPGARQPRHHARDGLYIAAALAFPPEQATKSGPPKHRPRRTES